MGARSSSWRRSHRWPALALAAAATLAIGGCGGSQRSSVLPHQPRSPEQFGMNVVRITGLSPADVAATSVLAMYPPHGSARPNGWILTTANDWRTALLAAQFGARPVNAGLLVTNHGFVPTPSEDVMGRLTPGSFPRSSGIQTLLLGRLGRDVLMTLTKLQLKAAQLLAPDTASLDLNLVPYRGGFGHSYSSSILIVSSQARDYSLPAGAWSAYSGDTVAFVTRDSVPSATASLLAQRAKLLAAKPAIYLLGPSSVISDSVASELSAYGTVKRIAGPTPIDTAVAFARYRDPSTGFGWGLTHGPASVSLLNDRDWGNAVAAFNLASTGPMAPLLLTDGPGPLPPAVASYLRQLQSTSPSQAFVVGGTASISSATLHEVDRDLAPLGTLPQAP